MDPIDFLGVLCYAVVRGFDLPGDLSESPVDFLPLLEPLSHPDLQPVLPVLLE